MLIIRITLEELEMLEGSIHLPAVFLLFQGLPLVIFFLSPGQGNINLGPAVAVYEHQRGNDGEARLLHGFRQLIDFAAGKQQFPVAQRLVVAVRTIKIGGDAHAFYPQLIVVDIAESVHQRGLSLAYALYLGAGEHDARRIGVHEIVFEGSLLVPDLQPDSYRIYVICVVPWRNSCGVGFLDDFSLVLRKSDSDSHRHYR